MIEQLLTEAPIPREISVQQDGLIYIFRCEKYALLNKLRSYIYLLNCQEVLQVSYISDIHPKKGLSHSFTLVLQDNID
ncbi:MAG: hypothetical protein RIG62_31250 [Cyclobacteriaceae bacterium]